MVVSPKAVLVFLSSIAGAFFVIFTILAIGQTDFESLTKDPLVVLNVDAEVSIPTWYAQSLFLLATGLLFIIGKTVKKDKKYWYGLAVIMLFMSIDEGSSIHELLIAPMRELLNISEGPFYYAWVIVYGLVFACIGLLFVRFFMRLPRKMRVLFVTSLALFLVGALGMEMVGGLVISQGYTADWRYATIVGIEELLEMLGATIFIYALLQYIAERQERHDFRLTVKRDQE